MLYKVTFMYFVFLSKVYILFEKPYVFIQEDSEDSKKRGVHFIPNAVI